MDATKHGGGFKSGKTKKQIQLVVITGREPENTKLGVWRTDKLSHAKNEQLYYMYSVRLSCEQRQHASSHRENVASACRVLYVTPKSLSIQEDHKQSQLNCHDAIAVFLYYTVPTQMLLGTCISYMSMHHTQRPITYSAKLCTNNMALPWPVKL